MQTTDNNNFNINQSIDSYNADAMSAYMQSVMGEEMWEKHKPTKNLSDFLTGATNDNKAVS